MTTKPCPLLQKMSYGSGRETGVRIEHTRHTNAQIKIPAFWFIRFVSNSG